MDGSGGSWGRPRSTALTILLLGAWVVGAPTALGAGSGAWDPLSARPGPAPPSPSSGCLLCHGSPAIVERGEDPRLRVEPARLARSAHRDLACQDCHGVLGPALPDHPAAKLAAGRASCSACHPGAARAIEEGAHGPPGRPIHGPGPAPPSCVDCHGAHGVRPVPSRAFAVALGARCSACHVERGEAFYLRDYHGKASSLGRLDVASCPDCHGGHRVLPASDPRSPVNPANVVRTCRRCHEDAPPNFRDILIHVGGWPLPEDPRLRAVALWMILILVGTFAFFGLHTLLAARHTWRERRAREGSG
ncbi:MAG TPA: cytochrome c3 family protein [Actinomycetota bacterium]|nr:cytochrome c3 family protein [Actinomycetota bacterium]